MEPYDHMSPSIKTYLSKLNLCMNYTFNTDHPHKDYTGYTQEELFALTPEHVYAYIAMKCYGTPDPNTNDLPTEGRSSTAEFIKKSISHFMPNKLMGWNERAREGNPTRSVKVNELIKKIKKQEVRKQGRKSLARRPFSQREFADFIRILRNQRESKKKYSAAALFLFQYNMIGRVDDASRFNLEDLTPCPEYDFCVQSKMCWSKNVNEERDAPNQLLMGADNPMYCILIAMGIHLEHGFRSGEIDIGSGECFPLSNQSARSILLSVIESPDFQLDPSAGNGNVGTHSLRKLASTYARQMGCSKDDVSARGRWKRAQQIVDRYIDVSLPYPDAKVAAALCVGGPVKYGFRNGCGLSDGFIIEHVSPFIATHYPRAVAVTLGKALLWAIYSDELSGIIDQEMKERVKAAVAEVVGDRLADGVSPIRKIPLIITGNEGALTITEMHDDENNDANNGGGRNMMGVMENEVRVILSNVHSLRCQLDEFKNEFHISRVTTNTLLRQLANSISRISQIPQLSAARARRRAGNGIGLDIFNRIGGNAEIGEGVGGGPRGEEEDVALVALAVQVPDQGYITSLSSCPRTLFVLWNEYEFGIGDRKAAKLFSSVERGRVKHKYSLRKVFWDQVIKMIRHGYTAHTAVDKIYEVYSCRNSVTKILQRMKNDRKRGGHPDLP